MIKYILAALLLSGCYQVVDSGDIHNSINFCKDKGGVHSVTELWFGYTTVECVDGTEKGIDYKPVSK